jgi:hypothetical protein
MRLASLVSFLSGCVSKPPAISDLRFPVAVVHQSGGIVESSSADELQRMHVNYVVMGKEPPALIDSALNLYLLEKLRSTKSGLWLMMNPNGTTPVSFELKRLPPGAAAARDCLLSHRWKGSDDAVRAEWLSKKLAAEHRRWRE